MERNVTRRGFARHVIFAAAAGAGASLLRPRTAVAQGGDVAHDAESIRQVVSFNGTPQQVFDALTDPARFTKMMAFSMVPKAKPAVLSAAPGAAFSLFDDHITGRNIEVVAARRLVQAWRAGGWETGVYSIARFEITANAGKAVITFDHTGFPKGEGAHLAEGWNANYWAPLRKFLG